MVNRWTGKLRRDGGYGGGGDGNGGGGGGGDRALRGDFPAGETSTTFPRTGDVGQFDVGTRSLVAHSFRITATQPAKQADRPSENVVVRDATTPTTVTCRTSDRPAQ